jgi:cell division protein FtsB
MFDFHQKRKLRAFMGSRFVQGFLLLVALMIFYSAYNRYLIAREMSDRREAIESEIQVLKERKNTLDEDIQYLSNERGIESEMRRQFDVARDGEQVIIIVEDEEEKEVLEEGATTTNKGRAWYQFW